MKLKTFNKTNGAITRTSDPMITVAKTGLFALNAALCKALNRSIGGAFSFIRTKRFRPTGILKCRKVKTLLCYAITKRAIFVFPAAQPQKRCAKPSGKPARSATKWQPFRSMMTTPTCTQFLQA